MSKRDETRRFSPIDVLAFVFLCLFALAVIVPATQVSRFEEYRTQCADNLSRIGRAMLLYANDYEDEFPRSGGRSSTWAPTIPSWNAFSRYTAYGISADGSGGLASISSCFYLLVKYAEVTPGTFVCPGDAGTTEFLLSDVGAGFGELIDFWDFGPDAGKYCSYAYQMPFGFYSLILSDDPGLAVAADRNPWMNSPGATAKTLPGFFSPDGGRESVKYANATAHEEEGQNVLFLDFHVAFEDHSFCGIHDDNIYTYWDGGDIRMGGSPTLGSQSMDRIDSLLVHDPISPSSTITTKEPEAIDSLDLKQTSIVPTLDSPLPKYQNVIWCSTFQMAWDKLKNDVIGEPVEVPGAEKLAGSLNAAEFSDKDLEEDSYLVTAGLAADGIVEQIRNEMAQRFGSEPAPDLDDMNGLAPETIIAYSFLNANIEFEHPFHINNLEFDFQDSNGAVYEVTSFCTLSDADSSDSVREQVDVLYYEQDVQTGETEFAVDLCKYTNPYQVVLACVPQQKNLDKTVAYAEQKISVYTQDPNYEELRKLKPAVVGGRTGGSQPAETLIVPDVLYKLTHHFAELEGKPIGNQPWLDQGYYIQKAVQMTDFTLARMGVILKSDDQIIVPPLGLPELRHFEFNRPFLIYIKKREPAASPFFVMWVDNAELMQEFQVESPD